MFYEPGKTDHGLSKNPFNSLIIPRPIGWISSVDKAGIVNLAPYSFFNAVSYRPPIVMFSGSRGNSSPNDTHKDSQRNIEERIGNNWLNAVRHGSGRWYLLF